MFHLVLSCILLFAQPAAPLLSSGELSTSTSSSSLTSATSLTPVQQSQLEEQKKRDQYRNIEAGILLTLGVGCLGLIMIGTIMLYSMAIKRKVQRDKAEQSKMMSGNSLVYLTVNPVQPPLMPDDSTSQNQ